jgi:lipoteichoic acid synthase
MNHEYGGQIDVLPTLLHILGIDSKNYVQFGTDLLSKQHNDLVPFRNGDFVSPTITAVDGKFYDTTTELEIGEDQLAEAKKDQQIVEQKLSLSDKVVNEDLLRFYSPKDFTPIVRTKYNYHQSQNVEVKP